MFPTATMESSDPGAKVPPRLSRQAGDPAGRKDHNGPVPGGSGRANTLPDDLVRGELGSKGKHSTPKSLK